MLSEHTKAQMRLRLESELRTAILADKLLIEKALYVLEESLALEEVIRTANPLKK